VVAASELGIASVGKSEAAIPETETQGASSSEEATSPAGTLLTEISFAEFCAGLWLAGALAAFFIVLF